MTDALKNLAGVPLVLIGKTTPLGFDVDYSGVPEGVINPLNGIAVVISVDDVRQMADAQRDNLVDALENKYASVVVQNERGESITAHDVVMTPADRAVYAELHAARSNEPAGDGALPPVVPLPAAEPSVTTEPEVMRVPVTQAEVAAAATAQPAAMTQKSAPDTHVTVHTDSVSLLHRLWADVVAGAEGAKELFEQTLHHVFPHAP